MMDKQIASLMRDRINKYRIDKNYSIEQLAQKSGLSRTFLSNFLSGKQKLSAVSLVKVANGLNVTVDELVCDSTKADEVLILNEISELMTDLPTEKRIVVASTIRTLISELKAFDQE